jgi:hypothetical protein
MKAQICFKQDTFRMHHTNLLGNTSKCVAVTISICSALCLSLESFGLVHFILYV